MSSDLAWFKSSYSNDDGGACVEVALSWHKPSYSNTDGGNCVEVAACSHTIHVRDSKGLSEPELAFGAGAWATFVGHVGR